MVRSLILLLCITVTIWCLQRRVAAQSTRTCTSREFICTDGQCVSSEKRCDGKTDCSDRSDENCCDQNDNNSGKEFAIGFLENVNSRAKLFLFMTSTKSLNYTVSAPRQGFVRTGFLQANTLVSVEVPELLKMQTGISDRGIQITASEPIAIYGLNQDAHTTDAFLALPVYIQGREYIVSSFTELSSYGYKSLIGIVGIHNYTKVTVVFSSTASDGTTSYSPGNNVTYNINWMQTLQLEGVDLTGSRIFSDKTIAVFGGHRCANVPVHQAYCDHLVEQFPPVESLGQHFATTPLATRTGGDLFRVIAARDGTDVTVNGILQASNLKAGNHSEFRGTSASFLSIAATHPILLVQYSLGSTVDSTTTSDPFMLMVPPVEQYRSHYIVSTPASQPVSFTNYLSIIVGDSQVAGLRLDDQQLQNSIVWNKIPGQRTVGATLSISSGSHTIHHVNNSRFGLSAYGYARHDSYGYPGGLQLKAQCIVQTPDQSSDVNECDSNSGRGPCQHLCNNTFGSFQCSCRLGYFLQADRLSCGLSIQPCRCSVNGICRTRGLCECRPGWGGPSCSDPQCHLVNYCSNKGKCIAPNTCQCDSGWTGFACAVSTCPQFSTCSACAAMANCGWCDSRKQCMTGTGFGPSDKDTTCPEWFFYRCVTVTLTSVIGNVIISSKQFSNRIDVIACDDSCIDNAVAHRGNSVLIPGSQVFCDRRKRACQSLYKCYEERSDLVCALVNNYAACRVHSEALCPGGLPLYDDRLIVGPSNSTQIKGGDDDLVDIEIDIGEGVDIVKTRIDFGFQVYCATFKNISEWNDYGCFCASAEEPQLPTVRQPVDETDKCCKVHDECYATAPPGCNCHAVKSFAYSASCNNWRLSKGFCSDVYLVSQRDECKRYCCQCDFSGADCIRQHKISKADRLWRNWLDPTQDQCTQRCGKIPGCNCQQACSGHGVIESVGRDAFCLCYPGWQGKCCDQPDCSCRNTNSQDCSGNGVCRPAAGDSKSYCSCAQGWRGRCCDRRIPVRRSCDPHLSTADGIEFDYFGIGEFWDCRSAKNDFGTQIRFFGYKNTSFAGAVAIKTENITTSIYTLNDTAGEYSLPKLRINGSLLNVSWSDYPSVHSISSDYVRLYVQPTRANGSLVRYLFQFNSGATYTVDVRYSSMLGRQYIDTELGLIASFLRQTEGLCGYMDNDKDNDLFAPDGTQLTNTTDFVESWRVDVSIPNSGDGSWSWMNSNFHPDDPLDSSYTNPYHRAVYGTNQLDSSVQSQAKRDCEALGLEGKLLDDCILDLALTGDRTVLQQDAFQQGKCPNDCSGRGQCMNGTCMCTDSWMGADCSEGGCDHCPANSNCVDGFCKCMFGFTGVNCSQATCEAVNNCTNVTHGMCSAPDVCQCNPGFINKDCSTKAICSHDCSYQGTCLGDEKCLCHFGWGGGVCNLRTCENLAYCSGHGTCRPDGTCECSVGWHGSACDLFSCDGVGHCSGHGDCIEVNTCNCHVGYTGLACNESTSCPSKRNCSGNGVCADRDTCLCFSGYFGDECDTFKCSQGCSGRGTCEAPNICSCILGWTGADCSEPSCEQLHYCSGNGKCVGPDTCVCDDGWGGQLCNDFDCSSSNRSGNCSSNGNCTGPGICSCSSGYCGEDCEYPILNECDGIVSNGTVVSTSRCDQICSDTCPSYQCACSVGYALQDDGYSCEDIDECNATAFAIRLNNCEQQCVNSPGSYYCNCSAGYLLSDDKGSCDDVDECGVSDLCSQKCINIPGSYNCSCNSGYQLNDDQQSCDDIDECKLGDTCSQYCNNTPGSYNCSCNSGYQLNDDQWSCHDIDECRVSNPCRQQCTNMPGSYNCSCNSGYQLKEDGQSCNDIDECAVSGLCSHQCINVPGSYNCSCSSGYRLNDDQFSCDDIDECKENSGVCSQLCFNTNGSFKCNCRDEFILATDGKTCRDLPTGSPQDVLIGATAAILSNTSDAEFENRQSVFSMTISREVLKYCQSSIDDRCGNFITQNATQLSFQVVSLVTQNSSLIVTFYIFSIDTSTHDIHIVSARHVVSALTGNNALEQAGYSILSLAAAPQPSMEPSTTDTGSTDTGGISRTLLIGVIAGGIAGLVLLVLFTVCCVHYCKKRRQKGYVI